MKKALSISSLFAAAVGFTVLAGGVSAHGRIPASANPIDDLLGQYQGESDDGPCSLEITKTNLGGAIYYHSNFTDPRDSHDYCNASLGDEHARAIGSGQKDVEIKAGGDTRDCKLVLHLDQNNKIKSAEMGSRRLLRPFYKTITCEFSK